ncbi:hypothetical protein HAX54_029469, partial [Datura stramonium]|nr:hypothetical protein [Datura stramonium]
VFNLDKENREIELKAFYWREKGYACFTGGTGRLAEQNLQIVVPQVLLQMASKEHYFNLLSTREQQIGTCETQVPH